MSLNHAGELLRDTGTIIPRSTWTISLKLSQSSLSRVSNPFSLRTAKVSADIEPAIDLLENRQSEESLSLSSVRENARARLLFLSLSLC